MASTLEIRDGLAWITMDDGKANALNGPFLDSLHAALDGACDQKAIVLCGRAGFFSGGLDVKRLPQLDPEALGRVIDRFVELVMRLWTSPVPVVALSTGHAIAGGCVILLCADYVVGLEGAFRVGLNEAAIGIPIPGLLVELARSRVQAPFQTRAVLHGEVFPLPVALQAGFLDEVCPADQGQARAQEVAARLAQLPPAAYQGTKVNLRRLSSSTVDLTQAIMHFFQSQRST